MFHEKIKAATRIYEMNKTKIIIAFRVTINCAFTYLANPVTNAHLRQGRLIMAHPALFPETSLLLHALGEDS